MRTKNELSNNMAPYIRSIVKTWDTEGILLEQHYPCLSSVVMENCTDLIYEIIIENGGHKVEPTEDWETEENTKPLCMAQQVDDGSYMYCLYDPSWMDYTQAGSIIRDSYTKQGNKIRFPFT